MTPTQRTLFAAEMMQVRKSDTTALLLTLFLGGLGAHRFYLRDMLGVVYVLFVWTFIPLLVSIAELFVISRRVEEYNKRQAYFDRGQDQGYGGDCVRIDLEALRARVQARQQAAADRRVARPPHVVDLVPKPRRRMLTTIGRLLRWRPKDSADGP